MKNRYVKSAPLFFRLIKISLLGFMLALVLLAVLLPAPLQEQGSLASVPNPVKSAWFLLWIQELVSYSKHLINLVLLLALAALLLPWLPGLRTSGRSASWFPKDQIAVTILTLFLVTGILLLTVVALCFRGENWAFISPF